MNIQQFLTADGSKAELILFLGLFFETWNIENIAGVILDYKKWNHAFINAHFIFTNIPGQLLT